MHRISIGNKFIGDGPNDPCFIVAEIGINHNGDLEIAKKLIDMAVNAGCDAVKFQKRTPDICVPEEQKGVMRDTPWGYMSYLEYRYKVEFDLNQYKEIDNYCRRKNIIWFASCWDIASINFMEINFRLPCYKIASASLTDMNILEVLKHINKPLILSTGMSTLREVDDAVDTLVGLIEPAMIVFLGLGVGFLLLAILLPIYNIAGAIK
jgi:N-acetylneuraminate synthase